MGSSISSHLSRIQEVSADEHFMCDVLVLTKEGTDVEVDISLRTVSGCNAHYVCLIAAAINECLSRHSMARIVLRKPFVLCSNTGSFVRYALNAHGIGAASTVTASKLGIL
jgi:hypothetical protein